MFMMCLWYESSNNVLGIFSSNRWKRARLQYIRTCALSNAKNISGILKAFYLAFITNCNNLPALNSSCDIVMLAHGTAWSEEGEWQGAGSSVNGLGSRVWQNEKSQHFTCSLRSMICTVKSLIYVHHNPKLNVSRLVLQLYLPHLLKSVVKSRMKM